MPLPAPPRSLLQDCALFLDFDGTLVAIADRPDAITVAPSLLPLLQGLSRKLDGRLVVVSGRATADIRQWLVPPEIAVVGSHGLERDGLAIARPAALDQALPDLRELQTRHPGVAIEEKPFGVAIHFRESPQAEEVCRGAAAELAMKAGMQVLPGKMVFEIKPADGNKGTAISALMTLPAFTGHKPLFIGDDITDEDGFAAVRALGGAAILVGDERNTAASFRLDDVDHVHRWLRDACEEME
ncbi:trehalose-phosphatase [Sphingomonas rosea]|uniref:Trehalose 6-phosphate phosphatase n=1 Tax=Sphingomonas rosea TaxID=335605 RepID=A0ABP7U702_9SPHN